ncbi:MAG TPA: hypothetical protein VFD21_15750 [Vicinamibacterales bacterium]|jgi:hypothetical protein|nr:hypothetical protein [Vicinamibacterales bacterium]
MQAGHFQKEIVMNGRFSFRLRRMSLAAALTALVAAATTALVLAQAPTAGHHEGVPEPSAGQTTAPTPQRQQMMQNMRAADQKVAELIAKMNAATGDRKVDAIAAVVTELAAQRKQMQEQMRMQSGMMEQMMSRMSAMHGSGGMMQGTPAPKTDATDPDHAAHHPDK